MNHLWQSTLFAGLAAVLTLALRKNPARVRHWVWLAASYKFLIPLSALISLGGHVQWRTVPEKTQPNVVVVIDRISRPFAAPPVSYSPLTIAPSAANPIPTILLGVWACGFLGIACSWWIRWRRIRDAVRAASPVHLAAPIPAKSSPALLEPGVFGIFRPVLLLPEGVFERLAPAQMQAVIAHELCHVRHWDNLAAAIHMLVETVFWFHPLVWWIGKRMVEERERACDEEVVRLGNEPRAYAEGILNVCKLYVESPLACVSGVAGANLKQRIQAILANRTVYGLTAAQKIVLSGAGVAAVALPVAIGMLNAPPIQAQSASAPKFDVAAIRPCENMPGRMRGGGDSSPGRLSTGCDLLADENNMGLIQRAYVRFAGGHTNRFGIIPVKGGPPWLHSQMYRIDANAEGHPSLEMMQGPMLQALLEDRFKLKIHRETKEGPVFALTPAKSGAKLKLFQEGSCVPMPMTFPLPAPPSGQRYCNNRISLRSPSIDSEGSTLAEFSTLLGLVVGRKVIDQTGIAGNYTLHLEFARDNSTPGLSGPIADAPVPASDPAGPTIFTAIQEQLGLKLVPAKGPIESLVIDHVEKPSEN
jgi:uncharacterized protein (TIGR03435 family)